MLKTINLIKKTSGLSLIEMLVTIAVISIGIMASYSLLASIRGTRVGNVAAIQAQQEARNILERIAREVRESSPEVLQISSMYEGQASHIRFYTPRNAEKQFIVDPEGAPKWQRSIEYMLDPYTHEISRYQYYMTYDPDAYDGSYHFESISKNAEKLTFNRVNDLLTISVRTFYDHEGKVGTVTRAHAELSTTVKLRN